MRFGPFRLITVLFGLTLLSATFLVGVVWGLKRIPPIPGVLATIDSVQHWVAAQRYDRERLARWDYRRLRGNLEWVDEIHPDVAKTDVAALITLAGVDDVAYRRGKIFEYIWGQGQMPGELLPTRIDERIDDPRYGDVAGLDRIDRLTVEMPHGVDSKIYFLTPKSKNGYLALYHQGHFGDFIMGKRTITRLLDEGFAVLAFSLPLLGMNSDPNFDIARFGHLRPFGHNIFHLLETEEFRPMRFFLDPIVVAMNYAQSREQFRCVAMLGLSTGAWMTTLYSALDPRICRSYPVAGPFPLYLRALPPNDKITNNRTDLVVGDYEEFNPHIFRIANVLELYAMAGVGDGRKLTLIFNKYDACCYRGMAVKSFEKPLKDAIDAIGAGDFELILDKTHASHSISEYALAAIVEDLRYLRQGNASQ